MKGVVEALRALGVRLEIISNDAIAGFDVRDPSFTVIPPETIGGTRALFDIHNNRVFTYMATQLIERANPEFIYQRYARFSWAGVAAAVRNWRPLFLEYNGSEVWVGRHWDRVGNLSLLERYERLNLLAAARIFVVSEVERRNLEAHAQGAQRFDDAFHVTRSAARLRARPRRSAQVNNARRTRIVRPLARTQGQRFYRFFQPSQLTTRFKKINCASQSLTGNAERRARKQIAARSFHPSIITVEHDDLARACERAKQHEQVLSTLPGQTLRRNRKHVRSTRAQSCEATPQTAALELRAGDRLNRCLRIELGQPGVTMSVVAAEREEHDFHPPKPRRANPAANDAVVLARN
jgi:hypothetical protein